MQARAVSGNFIAELLHLTEHCEFGDRMDDMRDQLVCGINDSRIHCQLLCEPFLTFKNALGLAQAFESADKYTQYLQTMVEETLPVHLIRTKQETHG